MHTEHLQNVRPGLAAGAWLIAIAVTSLVLLIFAALGILDPEVEEGGLGRSTIAVAIGFLMGGWFVGARAMAAPILHGIAMGLMTLVAWLVVNTVISLAFPAMIVWEPISITLALFVLFVQITAAVTGAVIGYRMALRGQLPTGSD
jgi:hypothetical protein